MLLSNKVRTAETAATTASFTRKFVRVGSVFAMLVIALCLLNACDKDEDTPDSLAGTTWALIERGEVIVTLEFKSGGKGVLTEVDDNKVENFTYSYEKPNVYITMDGDTVTFVISGNKMTEEGDDHVFIKQ
jgi:hypothetical protein